MEDRDMPLQIENSYEARNLRIEIHNLKQQMMHKDILIQNHKALIRKQLNVDLKDFTRAAMQGLIPHWVEGARLAHGNILGEQAVYFAKATLKALEEER